MRLMHFFALACLLASAAFAAENVSACRHIAAPGEYVLNTSLTGIAAGDIACINITSNDVWLDCAGFQINNDGTSDAYAVLLTNSSNFSIANCEIYGYDYGIYANLSSYGAIANNTFRHDGPAVPSGIGVALSRTNDTLVTNNTAHDISRGFEVGSWSYGNNVTGNTIYNVFYGIGFWTSGPSGSTISQNHVYNITGMGIISTGAGVRFINNSVHGIRGATSRGMFASGSGTTLIEFINNTVYDSDSFCLNTQDLRNCNITGNTFHHCGGSGIYLNGGMYYNVTGNTAYLNNSGFNLVMVTHSVAVGNTLHDTTSTAINAGYGNNITISDNSITNCSQGISAQHPPTGQPRGEFWIDRNSVAGSAWYGMAVSNLNPVHIANNTLANNYIGMHLLTGANITASNNTIYGSTMYGISYYATNNLTVENCHLYNNAIEIYANNSQAYPTILNVSGVVIDNPAGDYTNFTNLSLYDNVSSLSSYSIDWRTGTPPADAISFNEKYIDISPILGTVAIDWLAMHWRDDELAVYDENRLVMLESRAGNWADIGATLDTSQNTLSAANIQDFSTFGLFEAEDCMLIDAPGAYYQTHEYTGSPIDASDIASGGMACVKIASPNVIFDCNGHAITGNGSGSTTFGILVNGSHANVEIRNCPSVSNYSEGAHLHQVPGALVLNSTLHNNSIGLRLYENNQTTVSLCTARDNINYGFDVSFGRENVLERDAAYLNGIQGFFIGMSSFNELHDNLAYNNTRNGFNVQESSDYNLLQNCTARDNVENGFGFYGVAGNTVLMCAAEGNADRGIYIESSTGFNLTGNNVSGNEDGIVLNANSDYNALAGNEVSYNNFVGIRVEESSFNNLTSDVLHGNLFGLALTVRANGNIVDGAAIYGSTDGINVYASGDNVFRNCLVGDSAHFGYFERFGFGDFGGENASTIEYSVFHGNVWDIVQSSAYNRLFTLTNVMLGNSSINISLSDHSSAPILGLRNAYWINQTASPGPAPAGYAALSDTYLKVFFDFDPYLDSLSIYYNQSALNGSLESRVTIMAWNGTAWVRVPQQAVFAAEDLVRATNLTNMTADDIYGVFLAPPMPDGGDGGDEDEPLSLSLDSSCEGNVLTVESRGSPVSDARIAIDGALAGYTEPDGTLAFEGCGRDAAVHASRSGYDSADVRFELIDCEECMAVPECECGEIVDGQCVEYACCSDSGCVEGEVCSGHECVRPEEFECRSDDDCADDEYCDIQQGQAGGNCADVQPGPCGEVSGHAFVPYGYECGDEQGCPPCPADEMCESHECIAYSLEGPDNASVNDNITITARRGEGLCQSCDLEITSPSGEKSSGTTDGNGEFALPLDEAGTYSVALVRYGRGIAVLSLVANAIPSGGDVPEKEPQLCESVICIVPIALLLALLAWLLLQKGSKEGKKSGQSVKV